jgi:hypothetical protein
MTRRRARSLEISWRKRRRRARARRGRRPDRPNRRGGRGGRGRRRRRWRASGRHAAPSSSTSASSASSRSADSNGAPMGAETRRGGRVRCRGASSARRDRDRRASCMRRGFAGRGRRSRAAAQERERACERQQRPTRREERASTPPAAALRSSVRRSRASCPATSTRRAPDGLLRQRQAGGPDTLRAEIGGQIVVDAVHGGALKPAVDILGYRRARVPGFVGGALQRVLKEGVSFIPHYLLIELAARNGTTDFARPPPTACRRRQRTDSAGRGMGTPGRRKGAPVRDAGRPGDAGCECCRRRRRRGRAAA